MATRNELQSQLGTITGGGVPTLETNRGPCSPGIFSNVSVLRFGRSIPLVELFETLMITGLVLVVVTSSAFVTYHNMANILKSEGGSPSSINIANAAATSQPPWIATGAVLFVIGVLFYYLHRRIVSVPT